MNFAMQRTARPDGLCIAVAGEVDAYTAPGMRAQLLDALRLNHLLIVDLSTVTFMDSQGLAALLRVRQEAESNGGSLRLEGVPSRVLKLLQLTRLDSVFTIDSVSAEH
jgi:anti-sigma B factor antagonist